MSVEPDRGDEPRLRTVFTRLALAREPFSKLNEVDVAPNIGAVMAAGFHEIEAMDGAFPKILRAEETGDAVPDLYEALSRRLLKTRPIKKWHQLTLRQWTGLYVSAQVKKASSVGQMQ